MQPSLRTENATTITPVVRPTRILLQNVVVGGHPLQRWSVNQDLDRRRPAAALDVV
jgi:hypothetical protein